MCLPSVRCWKQISVEGFVNLEQLRSRNADKGFKAVNWHLASSGHVLKEIGLHFSVKFSHDLPEPEYVDVIFFVIVVDRVDSQVGDCISESERGILRSISGRPEIISSNSLWSKIDTNSLGIKSWSPSRKASIWALITVAIFS